MTAAKQTNGIDILLGQRLRQRREEQGMSQQELANALGVTFQQIQKYENAKNCIAASRLYLIALILDRPIEWFFEGEERGAD